MACIIAALVSVAFIVLQGISWVSLLSDLFLILAVLGFIYIRRMTFLFYRESLHLFQEIDARFTESFGSDATSGEMASPPGATFEERIQGLLQLDDRDAFLEEFRRVSPLMFSQMHAELVGQESKPAPRPETLEECHRAYQDEVLASCERETGFIKGVAIGALVVSLASGLLFAISLSKGYMGGYIWVLVVVFFAGLAFGSFLLYMLTHDQKKRQKQFSDLEARFLFFLQRTEKRS